MKKLRSKVRPPSPLRSIAIVSFSFQLKALEQYEEYLRQLSEKAMFNLSQLALVVSFSLSLSFCADLKERMPRSLN